MTTARISRVLCLSLLSLPALGPRGLERVAEAGSRPGRSPSPDSSPQRRLELREGATFAHEGDAVFGHGHAGEGFVQFESRVVRDYAVEIQLQTSTLTATFAPDFERGQLTITTNDAQLVASDWRAIRAADEALRTERGEGFNPLAALYLSRALSMLADSEPHFVWASRDVPLPQMSGQEASFYDAAAYRDPSTGPAVAALGRDVTLSEREAGLPAGVLSRPPVPTEGPPRPPTDGGGGTSGNEGPPKCTSYITDKANGKITCDQHGNYYCVEYDYYAGSIAQGQTTMKTAAPAIPPTWSRSTAAKVKVYKDKVLDGAYPCSGRCGPGCKDGPWISAGKAGGWGMGCLIHDQCVYQSTGGEELDKWWEQPENIQLSPDCGAEMIAAADDYFMPPQYCPGNQTVGGSGWWRRTAPLPYIAPKFKNKVSSTPAKRAGKVKKP